MLKQKLYGIGFVSWMVGITVLSLVSFEDETSLDIEIPYFDKFVHFTFYFVAGILGILFGRTLRSGLLKNSGLLLKFLLGLMAYGIIIEVLQGSLTTYRSAELTDILANSTGAFLGILLMRAMFSGETGSN